MAEGLRRLGRVLASPPWRRAPAQVWRSPSLAVGVLVAAFVLGLAGASGPMFSASAGEASLASDLETGCSFEIGLRVERRAPASIARDRSQLDQRRAALDEAVDPIAGMGPAVQTVFGGFATLAVPGGDARVQVVDRPGFDDHVEVLDGGDGAGLWLTDTTAEPLGVAVGDEVAVDFDDGGTTTLPVVAVYRDLRVQRDQWWCSMRYVFEERATGGSPPPPVALVQGIDVAATLEQLLVPSFEVWWEYPPDPDRWDLGTAEAALPRLRRIVDLTNDRVSTLAEQLGGGISTADRPVSVPKASSAVRTVDSVAAPVAWATIAVAVAMLLTAARSWMGRRAREVTALTLRGAGPVTLGLMAVGELGPALALGVLAGVGSAVLVVQSVGPHPGIDPAALREGVAIVATSTVLAVGIVVAVVAAGVRRVGVGAGGAAPRRRLVPWEPVVLAVAGAALYEVQTRPEATDGARLDGLLLVFPLLLLAGGGGVAARLLLSDRLLGGIAARSGGPVWLAARRMAAARARAALILTGATVSIGILVFAGATSASVRDTAEAKATLGEGAAQIARLSANEPVPDAPPLPGSTVVNRTTEPSVIRAGHDRADVLGVDPATFADAAYWDPSFADRSLGSLLEAVEVAASDRPDAVPVIAVGDGLPGSFAVTLDGEDDVVVREVVVVARARFFPGFESQAERPLVVLDRSVLADLGVVGFPEVWTDDESADVPARLADAGLSVIFSHRAADDLSGMLLQPQAWAIDYLEVIGVAAALVTVAGLGLHFAADAERRRLGAALAGRLGLPRRHVVGATVVEVATVLGGGLVFGVAFAWLALRLVFERLDPLPRTPPDPLLRYDLALVGVALLGAVLVTVAVTAVVERRSARASLPELLRAAR
jgi:putative ABC transport system permease protein